MNTIHPPGHTLLVNEKRNILFSGKDYHCHKVSHIWFWKSRFGRFSTTGMINLTHIHALKDTSFKKKAPIYQIFKHKP